ncbi:hypothetical protein QBC41DRAFT_321053 [Cercophora samala]|uniref:Uncharacterized protein n=1 Tax=Cercophora samala TaxID=330535 RepID=A0AA39ZDA1_9PEZI|nr:hypothetical protein QBC41DRAFT_321053 [Cercophora samala]
MGEREGDVCIIYFVAVMSVWAFTVFFMRKGGSVGMGYPSFFFLHLILAEVRYERRMYVCIVGA